MARNPLDLPASDARLRRLAHEGHLDSAALERAYTLNGHVPAGAEWRRFFDYLLLALGVVFLLSGIFFFFAYNWAAIPALLKLGLIQAAIVAASGTASVLGVTRLPGQIALTTAAALIGVLLAVYGQIYQPIADNYQLFLVWAIISVPWVAISRFAPLWLGWLVLLNLSLGLWADQQTAADFATAMLLLFVLNAGWLLGWETVRRRPVDWMQPRWVPQLVAIATFAAVFAPTLEFIFTLESPNSLPVMLAPIVYLLLCGMTIFVYTRNIRDLFILTICALSIIGVITAAAGKLIFDYLDTLFGAFDGSLVLSILVIVQAAVAVLLLQRLARRWEADQ